MAKKQKKTSEEIQSEHVSRMESHVKVITETASKLNSYRHVAGYKYDGNRINDVMQSIDELGDMRRAVDVAIEGIHKEMTGEILQLTRQQTATLKNAGIIKKRKRAKPAKKTAKKKSG